MFVVAVSSKPKDPGAAVVASGHSRAGPAFRQGLLGRTRRSETEVRRCFQPSCLVFKSSPRGNWDSPTALSNLNTGLFAVGSGGTVDAWKGFSKGHRGTETSDFYTKGFFFFSTRCHDAQRFPLRDNVHILLSVWCSSFVHDISFFFALHNVSIFDDLHTPWECLIQCFLP